MGALPYDTYIFDLDGTLTESEPGIVKSVQYALAQMGVEGYTRQDLRFVVGPPLMYSFREVLGMNEEDAYRAIGLYKERYAVTGYLENSVYLGVPAMLQSLKAQGARLAVATAKPEVFSRRVLAAFGLDKYFERVAAPRDEDETRFKERLVRRALPPDAGRACMVGDRDLDILAAKACGIDAIGALYGYGNREELARAGADAIAESVEALTGLLLGGAPRARGKFITLEGCDGCGKSTQQEMLAEYLENCGHRVVRTREPGGCHISERIRGIVLDAKEEGMCDVCEALLFAAARAQHVHQVIRPALLRGEVVLCDRFVDSSLVYQGAGRGLGDVVEAVNRPAVDGCMPDLTILLDIDPDVAMRRRVAADAPDRIEKEQSAFVRRVYRAYRDLAAAHPERYRIVDATGTREEVLSRIKEIVAGEV